MIEQLRQRVRLLEQEVQQLRVELRRDSSNSSKPPSSDPPWKPPAQRRGKGRKRGGQPGHSGHKRELVTPDEIIAIKAEHCDRCGNALGGEDSSPLRHQVTEVPQLAAHVTEYQLHSLRCDRCGEWTFAKLPPEVPHGAFGPRLQAIVAVCSSAYRLSKRNVEALVSDFFGVRISLGSISNLEQATSDALAEPYAQALSNVQEAQVLHTDETSWFQRAKQFWLWVAATTSVAAFMIRPKRNRKTAQELIGRKFIGVLVTDQYNGYGWLHDGRRQFCWAHLIRHFRALLDYPDSAAFGQQLLDLCERIFAQWHRIRDGTLRRRDLPDQMAPLQLEFHTLLEQGITSPSRRVRSICNGLLRHEIPMWTFVYRKGVEPTNNAAERALRHGVIWRKTSFGTDSDRGSRFVERMLTVITSLRLQSRHVLNYVAEAIVAHQLRTPKPSLLGA